MTAAPELIVCARSVLGVPGAEAVAVRAGRVETVGTRRSVLAGRGPATRMVDAPDGLLCAGFHDAHVHLVMTALRRLELDLAGLDAAGIAARVREAAAARPPGRWIVAGGMDPRELEGTRPRALLDEAAPGHPVLARAHDHHTSALNTAALVLTGFLTGDQGGVPPEHVERGADGEPTGLLREQAAVAAEARSGDLTPTEKAQAVVDLLPDLFAAGLTCLHDMSGSRYLEILQALDGAGALGLDVLATLAPGVPYADGAPDPEARLRVTAMKAFLDGALGSRTAHLLAPYADDEAHHGIAILTPEEARGFVEHAAGRGHPSCLHAIGDAAVRLALDALEGVTGPRGEPLRHRIEHAQMIHDDDLPRFAAAGIAASLQPIHVRVDAPLVRAYWGDRSRQAFPVRRLLDSGATVAFGSDMPIESFGVLDGVRAAVDRRGNDGSELHPEEAVTVEEALHAYTSGAARAAGVEDRSGGLFPGAVASLTLLDRDLVAQPEALTDCAVAATVVRGAVVFER